ncbi:bacteriohemerythrin [Paramagnetospirillum marisnigri]|nr:bacteriohemerythrin [Paramagnetospirillum marisnigri]
MGSVWYGAMKIGIDIVDDDHKQLFALVHEFNAAADAQGGEVSGAQMAEILTRLQNYVADHFQREEQMQLEAKYDGYEENKRQHEELTRTLSAFIAKHKGGGAGAEARTATREMREFLGVWLSQHILKTDLKMRGRILPWAG